MWYNTTKIVMTAGSAVGGTYLNAFDNALRSAGIADFNLIKVTSIVPPGIPVTHLKSGVQIIKGEGLLVPTVYETMHSDDEGILISTAVAVGIPQTDKPAPGVMFTHFCFGDKEKVENTIREMVKEGMREKGYDKHICKLASVTAKVNKPFTSVVAAAIFCDEDIEALFKGVTINKK